MQVDIKVEVYQLAFDITETLDGIARWITAHSTWLVVALRSQPPLNTVRTDFAQPHSYRYYRQLSGSNMVTELHSLNRCHQLME